MGKVDTKRYIAERPVGRIAKEPRVRDTKILTVHVDPAVHRRIDDLRARAGKGTKKDLVMAAIEAFEVFIKAREAGEPVVVGEGDGRRQVVLV